MGNRFQILFPLCLSDFRPYVVELDLCIIVLVGSLIWYNHLVRLFTMVTTACDNKGCKNVLKQNMAVQVKPKTGNCKLASTSNAPF